VPPPGSPPPSYGNPPAPAAASYAPATFGSAPAGYSGPPAAFGQPPQFDGPGGGMFGQPPAANPAGGSAGGPPPGTTYGAPAGQGYGSAPAGYAPPPQGYAPERGSAPAAQYGQGVYGSAAGDTGRGSEPEWPGQTPERKPKRGLIIALIVTAVLVVVGVGAYVGWSMKNSSSEFVEGACVQQRGGDAAIVDCSVSGAYKIDSIVDTEGGCPDAGQPSLVLTPRGGGATRYGCLVPASGS
jgi:hypothetical protein